MPIPSLEGGHGLFSVWGHHGLPMVCQALQVAVASADLLSEKGRGGPQEGLFLDGNLNIDSLDQTL